MIKLIYFCFYNFHFRQASYIGSKDRMFHYEATWSLSFLESLIVSTILKMFLGYYFCKFYSIWPLIVISVFILLLNEFYFIRLKKGEKLIESQKNVLFKKRYNSFLGIVVVSSFCLSFFLIGSEFETALLTKCS